MVKASELFWVNGKEHVSLSLGFARRLPSSQFRPDAAARERAA
jgi:hypothetical protein